MEILRSIQLYAESRDMPFLVIGGHAVNAYGIARQTADLDLLIPLAHRDRWCTLMERIKYHPDQLDDHFARFQPPDLAYWPIDFMFVDDDTFEKLYADGSPMAIGVAEPRVVSARHLLTLKIHALRQGQEHRRAKDLGDAAALLRSGLTGLCQPELEALCLQYADRTVYVTLRGELKE